MKLIVYGLALLVLVGCGSSGGSSTSTVNKPLASLWTRDSDNVPIDLTGVTVGQPFTISLLLSSTELCTCTSAFYGTENAGNYGVSGCAHVSGPTPSTCSAHDATGSYLKSATTLRLTVGGTSSDFH